MNRGCFSGYNEDEQLHLCVLLWRYWEVENIVISLLFQKLFAMYLISTGRNKSESNINCRRSSMYLAWLGNCVQIQSLECKNILTFLLPLKKLFEWEKKGKKLPFPLPVENRTLNQNRFWLSSYLQQLRDLMISILLLNRNVRGKGISHCPNVISCM